MPLGENELNSTWRYLTKGKRKYIAIPVLILGTGITLLANQLDSIETIYGSKLYESISKMCLKAFNWLAQLLNLEFKLWAILVFILGVVMILGLVIFLLIKLEGKEKKQDALPGFLEYNEDFINGLRWTWKYENKGSNWGIQDITAYCPSCDTGMLHSKTHYSDLYECPRCNECIDNNSPLYKIDKRYTPLYKIEAIIIDNIKRKEK